MFAREESAPPQALRVTQQHPRFRTVQQICKTLRKQKQKENPSFDFASRRKQTWTGTCDGSLMSVGGSTAVRLNVKCASLDCSELQMLNFQPSQNLPEHDDKRSEGAFLTGILKAACWLHLQQLSFADL